MARNKPVRNPPLAERVAGDPSQTLIWIPGDKYHQRTAQGHYVAKCWTATGWRYVASMNKQIIGVFDTAPAARSAAEGHSQGETK